MSVYHWNSYLQQHSYFKMKTTIIFALAMSVAYAIPSPALYPYLEETEKVIYLQHNFAEERTGQDTELHSSVEDKNETETDLEERAEQTSVDKATQRPTEEGNIQKGFLDELFEGVADAVTGGALSPLASSALKPLVSSVGSILVDQIFGAANDIISEWKKSKQFHFEANPIYIPNRGSFILVNAIGSIPVLEIDYSSKKTDDKKVEYHKENSSVVDMEANYNQTKITEKVTDKNNSNTINENYVNNVITNIEVSRQNFTNLISSNKTIYVTEENKNNGSMLLTDAQNTFKNNFTVLEDNVGSNFSKPQNLTEDDLNEIADFELNNEIERRSVSEDSNGKVAYEISKAMKIEVNKTDAFKSEVPSEKKTEVDTDQYTETINKSRRVSRNLEENKTDLIYEKYNMNKIKSKINDINNNFYDKLKTTQEPILLRSAYLVPVKGNVDWLQDNKEIAVIQEAVKAAVAARTIAETRHRVVEQYFVNKIRAIADVLESDDS